MNEERKRLFDSIILETLSLAFVALVLCATAGWAHTDPPGANLSGTAGSLGIYSDAACTVPLSEIVTSAGERVMVIRAGQTAYLQATLDYLPGTASYEGGVWRLRTFGSCTAPGPPVVLYDPLVPQVFCISPGEPPSTDDPNLPGGRGLCGLNNPNPDAPGTQISPCVPYVTTATDDANGSIFFQSILGDDTNPMSLDNAYAHIGVNDQLGVFSSISQCVLIRQPACGDGIVDPGETCDPQDPMAPPNCRPPGDPEECTYCGDGNQEASEECDDGNNVDGDGCDSTCQIEPFCGDGTVDPGETCDPQDPAAPANCRPVGDPEECTYCGDGNQEASEQCDDGNNVDGDGCEADCTITDVPTLGQWGAILLALVLLVLGALGARAASRRRTV